MKESYDHLTQGGLFLERCLTPKLGTYYQGKAFCTFGQEQDRVVPNLHGGVSILNSA